MLIFLTLVVICTSCKKDSDNSSSKVSQQLGQLVTKYSNLKLTSVSRTQKQQLSDTELIMIDDSLASFSAKIKSIHVISTTIINSSTLSNHTLALSATNRKIPTNVITDDVINGSGSYPWSAYQIVGSSKMGNYRVNYFALFSYNTINTIYNVAINSITSVSGIISSAAPVSFTYGTLGYTNTYAWSYAAAGSGYGLQSDNQIGSLSYNGQVTCQSSTTISGITYNVSGISEGLAYNPMVASSIFPFIAPQ